MAVSLDDPLTNPEAYALIELCEMLAWEKPINGKLLAGWCVVAVICGALKWRPHIWLTGPAGSGKTWVFENILRRTLGDMALAVQSETTAAGIRQALGSDARPVIFDEAEGENAKAQARIHSVMALMRQASSETGAVIAHGTTDGGKITYRPRSCFAFASIGIGVRQYADQTRVTVLALALDHRRTPSQRAAHFEALQEKWHATLTSAYIRRLHARIIRPIPVIRQNAETFAVAGARVIGTGRLGDQIGALLAGAYALHSMKAITPAEANRWLEEQDWSDESQMQEEQDERACLERIPKHIITVQVKDERGTVTRLDRSGARAHARGGRGGITSPLAGTVVEILVGPGSALRPGRPLSVIEAAGVASEIEAAVGGRVPAVLVGTGQAVEAGAELIRVEPVER